MRRVGEQVHEHAYHLAASSRTRWALRSDLLICHPEDEETMREALTRS